MKLEKFSKILRETPPEVLEDVKFNMLILDRIHELLNKKFGGKQKLLAEAMGKSEAEISKLLSGIQNYTTRTLMKLQKAFGEPIIAVCTEQDDVSQFVQVKDTSCIKKTQLVVNKEHDLLEIEYTTIQPKFTKQSISSNISV